MINNSLLVINPYYDRGSWVFDDEITDLVKEPFVAGMPEMIERLIEKNDVKDAKDGFSLTFSKDAFPSMDMSIRKISDEHGGSWYSWDEEDMKGWLCPALLKYFETAPDSIFVKIGELTVSDILEL